MACSRPGSVSLSPAPCTKAGAAASALGMSMTRYDRVLVPDPDPRLRRLPAGSRDLAYRRRNGFPVRAWTRRPVQSKRVEKRHPWRGDQDRSRQVGNPEPLACIPVQIGFMPLLARGTRPDRSSPRPAPGSPTRFLRRVPLRHRKPTPGAAQKKRAIRRRIALPYASSETKLQECPGIKSTAELPRKVPAGTGLN